MPVTLPSLRVIPLNRHELVGEPQGSAPDQETYADKRAWVVGFRQASAALSWLRWKFLLEDKKIEGRGDE